MIECLLINPLLLAADPGSTGALTQLLFFFAPLFAIWYFLVLRPQSQQRKKLQQLLGSLKSGDRVVTSGGIYGTIVGMDGETVQLRIADQVKIKITRSSIADVQSDTPQE